MSRGNIILRPCGDFTVAEGLSLAPTDKGKQRFVVGVVHKHILQSIAIRVLEHGAE